mmetsp:Transcript_38460/g.151807  ORF Transcript_38460/g.151807 Transcript_38460/m.151807 type:complete len:84 (+) Transcript_38460:53-304(+)
MKINVDEFMGEDAHCISEPDFRGEHSYLEEKPMPDGGGVIISESPASQVCFTGNSLSSFGRSQLVTSWPQRYKRCHAHQDALP